MCQNKATGAAAGKEVFHPGRIHLFIQQIQDLVQDKDSLSFPSFFRISAPQLSRLEMQILSNALFSNCSENSRQSNFRFPVRAQVSNNFGAAVTSPGHQRTACRGRDLLAPAEGLTRSKAQAESRLCICGLQLLFQVSTETWPASQHDLNVWQGNLGRTRSWKDHQHGRHRKGSHIFRVDFSLTSR